MNTKEIIARHKGNPTTLDWKSLASELANQVIEAKLKEFENSLTKEFNEILESFNVTVSQIIKDQKEKLDDLTDSGQADINDIVSELDAKCNLAIQQFESKLSFLKGADGDDGKDADDEAIYQKLLTQIPPAVPGIPGKDGSPDTPDQIATKVNTLENKIEQKAIKGLIPTIAELWKAIRASKKGGSGGGGMGNVQHETKSVGSATTTITTTHNIAGGGFAIWAYYQGQNIVRGTHYTVNGKTLTLTFTPQDSTSIDLIYMRT